LASKVKSAGAAWLAEIRGGQVRPRVRSEIKILIPNDPVTPVSGWRFSSMPDRPNALPRARQNVCIGDRPAMRTVKLSYRDIVVRRNVRW
jgi:hypothetical protein